MNTLEGACAQELPNDPCALPYATPELPGIGGAIRVAPEDFEVEELPAYQPSGSGEHLFLWVEKRGLNTRDVALALARALGLPERDVGVAGQKDRRALTRQFFSVPAAAAAKASRAGSARLDGEGEGWHILSAQLHQNKLKTGHLKGNRFSIVVRETKPGALERAQAIARALEERGLPNAYGPQRFGRDGRNAQLGLRLLRALQPGSPPLPREYERAARDRFQRRLYISSLQAALFNSVLAERLAEGLFDRALEGDILKRSETGGIFHCEEPTVDSPRVASFELSPTGPIFGHRMMTAKGEALAREERVLGSAGLTLASFAPLKGDAEGSRRPMRLKVALSLAELAGEEGRSLRLTFSLPKGSFATALLREVMKGPLNSEPGLADEQSSD